MRLVEGRGNRRIVTELPGLAIRVRDPQEHQRLIVNLQERLCPRYALERKGFRIYER